MRRLLQGIVVGLFVCGLQTGGFAAAASARGADTSVIDTVRLKDKLHPILHVKAQTQRDAFSDRGNLRLPSLSDKSFRRMMNMNIGRDDRYEWPIAFGRCEELAAMQLRVRLLGLNADAVERLLGPPAFRFPSELCFENTTGDGLRSHTVSPDATFGSGAMEDNWLYFFGGSPILIRPIFQKGKCIEVTAFTADNDYVFNLWRRNELEKNAIGKSRKQIEEFAGLPFPGGLDEDYRYGNLGVVLKFIDGRCVEVIRNSRQLVLMGPPLKPWEHQYFQSDFKMPSSVALQRRQSLKTATPVSEPDEERVSNRTLKKLNGSLKFIEPCRPFDGSSEKSEERLAEQFCKRLKGLSKSKIIETFGAPYSKGDDARTQPLMLSNKDNWLFIFGLTPEFVRASFKNGICDAAWFVPYDMDEKYCKWRRSEIARFAVDKTKDEIVAGEGTPTHLRSLVSPEFSVLDYMIGTKSMSVYLRNDRCTVVDFTHPGFVMTGHRWGREVELSSFDAQPQEELPAYKDVAQGSMHFPNADSDSQSSDWNSPKMSFGRRPFSPWKQRYNGGSFSFKLP